MASVLCGCSKKSRPDRSSRYVATGSGEQTPRPPTTISQLAPVTQYSLHDSLVRRSGVASGAKHVERYLAGGGAAVTVSVRQQHHHHHRHHHHHDKNVNDDDSDVRRQLSNYEAVLDEYLRAAIATQHANISYDSNKVQHIQ